MEREKEREREETKRIRMVCVRINSQWRLDWLSLKRERELGELSLSTRELRELVQLKRSECEF